MPGINGKKNLLEWIYWGGKVQEFALKFGELLIQLCKVDVAATL